MPTTSGLVMEVVPVSRPLSAERMEMAGVRTPSPMSMPVDIIATTISTICSGSTRGSQSARGQPGGTRGRQAAQGAAGQHDLQQAAQPAARQHNLQHVAQGAARQQEGQTVSTVCSREHEGKPGSTSGKPDEHWMSVVWADGGRSCSDLWPYSHTSGSTNCCRRCLVAWQSHWWCGVCDTISQAGQHHWNYSGNLTVHCGNTDSERKPGEHATLPVPVCALLLKRWTQAYTHGSLSAHR